IFEADVDAQGGAYATGVLVLMTSAAFAVMLSMWREGWQRWAFLAIFLVFVYTTLTNMIERPEGLKIALFFIGSIMLTSLVSRLLRTAELRVEQVEMDEVAQQFVRETSQGTIRIIANQLDAGDEEEYRLKEKEERENNHIPASDPVLFFEVTISD